MNREPKITPSRAPQALHELQPLIGKSVTDGAPVQYLQWLAVSLEGVPDPRDRARIRFNLEHDLQSQFTQWLTPRWSAVFSKRPKERTDEENRVIVDQFDRFLIGHAAELLGPRLFLCDVVVRRLIRWNDQLKKGPDLLQQFFQALLRGTKVRRGQRSGSVDRTTKIAKQRLLSECRQLRERIKILRAQTNRNLRFENLIGIVESNSASMSSLFKNLPSLRAFYAQRSEEVEYFLTDRIRPAQFVAEWLAWSKCRSTKALRNDLSELSSQLP
jgi:hypothetical protein